MTILFVTHYDNLYGANNAMLSLALKLSEEGNKVFIAGPVGSGGLEKKLNSTDIRYIPCEMTQWQAVYTTFVRFLVKKLKRKPLIEKQVDYLYNLLKDEHIDIVHSNSSVIVQGALLADRIGAKHIWHIREFSKEHFNMRYFYPAKVVSTLYTKADCLIAISNAIAENYREKYKDANIVRIYDGVDRVDDNSANEDNEKEPCVRFVYVGYLFEKKHQLEVIKACKRLYQEGYKTFELNIVGDGKPDYRNKLIKEAEGCDYIKLHGYVKDVNGLLDSMDVGIIGSEYEGFGLVTVEYMLAGLPVIGYNHGGTKEIVADLESGFLYDTEDDLVNAMKRLIEDRELCKRMGNTARNIAKVKFTVNNNLKSVRKLYQELIN